MLALVLFPNTTDQAFTSYVNTKAQSLVDTLVSAVEPAPLPTPTVEPF